MFRVPPAVPVLLTLLPTLAAFAAEKHPGVFLEFTDADKTALRAGETVTWCEPLADARKCSVHCAILLQVRPADAWALIDDKEGACHYISDLQSCRVLRKDSDHELIEQTTRPAGSPRSFTYLLRHEATFPSRMDFKRQSGDLRDIEGSWVFDPVDEGAQTLLIYALHIDAGMFMPQKLICRSQQKRVPSVMTAIRDQLTSRRQLGLCCGVDQGSAVPAESRAAVDDSVTLAK